MVVSSSSLYSLQLVYNKIKTTDWSIQSIHSEGTDHALLLTCHKDRIYSFDIHYMYMCVYVCVYIMCSVGDEPRTILALGIVMTRKGTRGAHTNVYTYVLHAPHRRTHGRAYRFKWIVSLFLLFFFFLSFLFLF